MNKSFLIIYFVLLVFNFSSAQDWQPVENTEIIELGVRDIIPIKYQAYIIDDKAMKSILRNAPSEKFLRTSDAILQIPLADGSMDQFKICEYRMMDVELQKKYPFLKTFKGVSVSNPYRRIRIDYTLHGFRAVVRDPSMTTFIDHYQRDDKQTRIVYDAKNYKDDNEWECHFSHEQSSIREQIINLKRSVIGDCIFREYRLALACTGEYATFHGGTVPLVLSAFVTSINRVNQVYEYDNAVRMNLIANTDAIIYLDAATDPYTNNNGVTMLGQNQTTCDNVIGSANYDIGHVFSTGGGGVASLGSVCNNSSKARGVTGLNSPVGDPFDIDYVSHEIGHQYGGNHTQNNSCNRNGATAMEPGSASTIMGYAGICNPNVQNNSDDYFHSISLQEMMNEMQSGGHTCEIDTMGTIFNNTPPVVVPQGDYTIPASTYFSLELTASDADGDPLEYLWDQMDNQVATMPPVSTNTGGPTFRSIKFTPSPIRYFPSIDNIIDNTNDTWEVLPSVSRTMNFRGTAKDYNTIGGCNDEEDVVITVDGNSGPFIVTRNFNNTDTLESGTMDSITWDVASTDSAPVGAAFVDVILSLDGGFTYTDTLGSQVPNNGTFYFNVPPVTTDSARIMVRGYQNVFFDINNNSFSIRNNTPGTSVSLLSNPFEVCIDDATGMTTVQTVKFGPANDNVDLNILNNSTSAIFTFGSNPILNGTSTTLEVSNFGTLSGDYPMQIEASGPTYADTSDFILKVITQSPPITLISPTDHAYGIGVNSINFSWQNTASTSYRFELSDNYEFSSLIVDDTVTVNNFTFSGGLDVLTTYYWRVSPTVACGQISEPTIFSFTTNECGLYYSTDVPKAISASGTPTVTSTLSLSGNKIISDFNIVDLEITHSWVEDLDVSISGSLGGSSTLFTDPCGSQDNVDIGFDDEASSSSYPCPPVDGLSYIPESPLTTFDGSSFNNVITLTVFDDTNQDGGSLDNWGVEACVDASCVLEVFQPGLSGLGSLTEAINCASSGDTVFITKALSFDTIQIGPTVISKNLHIIALGEGTVVQGNNSRLFSFENFNQIQFENFEIINENSSGEALYIQRATLRIKDMLIKSTMPGSNQITNAQGTLEILSDSELRN